MTTSLNWKRNNALGVHIRRLPWEFRTCRLLQCVLYFGESFISHLPANALQVLIGLRHPAIREERQTREPAVVPRNLTVLCQSLPARVPSQFAGSQTCAAVISDRNHSRSRSRLVAVLNPDFLTVSYHKTIPECIWHTFKAKLAVFDTKKKPKSELASHKVVFTSHRCSAEACGVKPTKRPRTFP